MVAVKRSSSLKATVENLHHENSSVPPIHDRLSFSTFPVHPPTGIFRLTPEPAILLQLILADASSIFQVLFQMRGHQSHLEPNKRSPLGDKSRSSSGSKGIKSPGAYRVIPLPCYVSRRQRRATSRWSDQQEKTPPDLPSQNRVSLSLREACGNAPSWTLSHVIISVRNRSEQEGIPGYISI